MEESQHSVDNLGDGGQLSGMVHCIEQDWASFLKFILKIIFIGSKHESISLYGPVLIWQSDLEIVDNLVFIVFDHWVH